MERTLLVLEEGVWDPDVVPAAIPHAQSLVGHVEVGEGQARVVPGLPQVHADGVVLGVRVLLGGFLGVFERFLGGFWEVFGSFWGFWGFLEGF